MSDQEIEQLRVLVRADRRARSGPFSADLRERLQAFLKRRWERGESLKELAGRLGLSNHTVQYWRSHWGERREREIQLRRVEVIAERPLPASLLTVHGPAGTRIEGLTVEEVAELWRQLS